MCSASVSKVCSEKERRRPRAFSALLVCSEWFHDICIKALCGKNWILYGFAINVHKDNISCMIGI